MKAGKMNGKRGKNTFEYIWIILVFILLPCFLFCGLKLFRDYGATSDEINQIEAGHITWTAICEHFGKPAPDFGNIPKLKDYYNRYYGQAATFPTVIFEAIKGFTLDISTILRLRHLWNFMLYITGLICFGILIKLRSQRFDVTFFALLIHMLTPRLFGDAFYNDRDVLLISLIWISLFCYVLFQRKPGILTVLICAFFFAVSINTRFFALILLILPLLQLFQSSGIEKKYLILLFSAVLFFWYLITPLFWGGFFNELTGAFQMFATGQQRTQETNGLAEVLFFGKYYRENNLPFYYLPLWIFISTPLVPQSLCAYGLFRNIRKSTETFDRFMILFLCLGIAAVMLIRPVLYTGWRHMYFFYVPVFWFIGIALNSLLTSTRNWIKPVTMCFVILSGGITAMQMMSLHPYEYIYLNPLFQSQTGEFDRDYWRLSTTDCLKWITGQEDNRVSVGEINENLDNSIIGLLPELRDKIRIQHYNALHRNPAEYLIFNYSESIGNQKNFPLYSSVFFVERDGTKLSEIYKRIEPILPEVEYINITEITDNNIDTEWRSELPQNPGDELIIKFSEPTVLTGLSLLPGNNEQEYARSAEVSISKDGDGWDILPLTISGLFDLSFPKTETKWLRIRNTENTDVHWSVREIFFY